MKQKQNEREKLKMKKLVYIFSSQNLTSFENESRYIDLHIEEEVPKYHILYILIEGFLIETAFCVQSEKMSFPL